MDENELPEYVNAYLVAHGYNLDELVARMRARIFIALQQAARDFDGLNLCETCGDAYTRGRLCTSCAQQKAIDES